jgi:hypothetical protein
MYYRIIGIKKGPWINATHKKTLTNLVETINTFNPEIKAWIDSTEFLVLNGINQGKGSINQYKPSTIY